MKKIDQYVYKNSRQYKMLIVLQSFRKGLKITHKSLGDEIHISHSLVSYYEYGKIRINNEVLKAYASVIAEKMRFDFGKFYRALEREASKMLVTIDNASIVYAATRIVNEMTEGLDTETDENRVVLDEFVSYNRMAILGTIRRLLGLTTEEMMEKVGTNRRINRYERGALLANEEFTAMYIQGVSTILNIDNKEFDSLLTDASKKIHCSKKNIPVESIIAFSKILKTLKEYRQKG